jgi:hypothetical protein
MRPRAPRASGVGGLNDGVYAQLEARVVIGMSEYESPDKRSPDSSDSTVSVSFLNAGGIDRSALPHDGLIVG